MIKITGIIAADKSLSYIYGGRRVLKDRTVAVSVSFSRNRKPISGQGLGFVFHYHPGSKGAQPGGTEGSKWHFKPHDGANKWVRMADHEFAKLDQSMVTCVKDIARNKK